MLLWSEVKPVLLSVNPVQPDQMMWYSVFTREFDEAEHDCCEGGDGSPLQYQDVFTYSFCSVTGGV